MTEKVSKVARVSKSALVFLLFSISCTWFGKDQPDVNTETSESFATATMTLFYPKPDGSGVAQIQTPVEDVQKDKSLWFALMIKQLSEPAGQGVPPVFPTVPQVYGLFFENGVMYIDFSSEIQRAVHSSIQMEQLSFDAFLSSIKANFPGIKRVKILVEHEDVEMVFGHIYAQHPFDL